MSPKLLIIDDFHLAKLNQRFQGKFLELVSDKFDKVLIFSDQSMKYNESEYVSFSTYNQLQILPFGHVKRGELISKWNSLGREEIIDIRSSHIDDDRSRRNIDSIIRKNIVPPKPIYI